MRLATVFLLVAAALATTALTMVPAGHAQDEDLSGLVVPDSLFEEESLPGPDYLTIYDRDNTRSNWSQTLTYSRVRRGTAISISGDVSTQELSGFENKSTIGQFTGRLSRRITRRWVVSMDGRHGMNSNTDGTRDTESHRNRLLFKTQYTLNPLPELSIVGSLSSEFRREHDLAERQNLRQAFGDSGVVDTLRVQRDSSFTTGRQDGLLGQMSWRVKRWLAVSGSAAASRVRPTQSSLIRDFTNPLDGSGGGSVVATSQRTREPTDNAVYTSKVSFSKIRGTVIDVNLQKSALDQSTFDKQLRGQERASFDRNSGSFRLQSSIRRRFLLTVDGALVRSERQYTLRTNFTSLVRTRQMSSMLAYSDTSTRLSTMFTVSRTRSELQASGNGIILTRQLNANAYRKLSGRLALDATGSAYLQTSQYVDERSDQDVARASMNLGGGYRVSASCSTTVHFSASRGRSVFIDPSASSTNAVQTTYQMNATMRLRLSRSFFLNQNYLLSADYRIFDFTEDQNFLNRVRRIDTDLIDTVFSFAYVRLTHNFIFRDQGTYSRDPGESSREYSVSVETYDQTLAATVGIAVARGIRILAGQSLLNQRNHFLVNNSRTLRNRWNLSAGIEIERGIWDGAEIRGAVRHIGSYDEQQLPNLPNNEEDYWIAGVTFHKQF